jgi:hypothetical protein
MRIFCFRILSLFSLILSLTACSSPTSSTPIPSPLLSTTTLTVGPLIELTNTEISFENSPTIALIPESTSTETPTSLPTLTETLLPTLPAGTLTSTRRPTWTRTPSKTPIPPLAGIRITRPGLLSRVLSPFRLEASAIPAPDGWIQLALIGEDGRVLINRSLHYAQSTSEQVFIQEEIEFSISGVAETARLVLYTLDPFDRMISLSSVDLVLLSLGEEQISPPVSLREPLFIIRPYLNEPFSNNLITVRGLISPVSNQPLIFEAISEQNIVLFSTTLDAGPVTAERAYVPFEITIPYTVQSFTRARLTLRQDSDTRIPGTMALSSQTISLSP